MDPILEDDEQLIPLQDNDDQPVCSQEFLDDYENRIAKQ